MSAAILAFPDKIAAERAALITQERANYDSIFPAQTTTSAIPAAQERNRARLDTIKRRDNFKFRTVGPGADDPACDDLMMDHADPSCMPSDSTYHAPESDPA